MEKTLRSIDGNPNLVITDSQVFGFVSKIVPKEIPLTSFSIVMARLRGDFDNYMKGTPHLSQLKDGDKVLLLESCTHHSTCDDIGRVKIPRWLGECTGARLEVDVSSGRDFPEDLARYKLIVQCGGCMLNRREMLSRLQAAAGQGVPVTNYGMCISYAKGVFDRVMSPFRKELENL